MKKEDCFAYDKTECAILIEMNCDNCKFYKTYKQKTESDINSIKRLVLIGYPKEKLVDMPGWAEYMSL